MKKDIDYNRGVNATITMLYENWEKVHKELLQMDESSILMGSAVDKEDDEWGHPVNENLDITRDEVIKTTLVAMDQVMRVLFHGVQARVLQSTQESLENSPL